MDSQTLDPRKPLKTALELAEEKAAAAAKVSEISQGLVSEAAPVDPVAQGSGKMTQHVEGTPATSAAAAEAAATKPGFFKRAIQKMTPSRGTAGMIAANAADMVIPRADDSTDTGYNVNTARDTAMSALNTGTLVPMLLKTRNPYAIGGAAALGGGIALYNRLHNYNSQHPENDAAPLQLPNASPYFQSQAPAAIHDAGHLASQALRGLGDGVGYDVEHYTPYPYLRQGAQKAVDYFTTTPTKPKFEGGAKILRDATQGPVSEMNSEDLHEAVNSQVKLPSNVKQENDGSYTKSIYDDRGNYLGYGNQKSPYATADQALKQELTPQAQALYERNKAIMDSRISNNPPVMTVSPSGNAVQTNYDANGDIVRNQNPEVQQRVQDILRDRAIAAQAQMPEFEAGNVDRFNNFQAKVKADRGLESAQSLGESQDPVRNQQAASALYNAAREKANVYGGEGQDYLPEVDPRNRSVVQDAAREMLRRQKAGLREMTPGEAAMYALSDTPSQYNSQLQEELQKRSIINTTPGEKVTEMQEKLIDRDLARDQGALDRKSSREVSLFNAEESRNVQRETNRLTAVQNQLKGIETQIADLSKTPTLAKANEARIKSLNKRYDTLLQMDDRGVNLPQETPENAPQNSAPVKPDPSTLKVGDIIQTLRGPGRWDGKKLMPIT